MSFFSANCEPADENRSGNELRERVQSPHSRSVSPITCTHECIYEFEGMVLGVQVCAYQREELTCCQQPVSSLPPPPHWWQWQQSQQCLAACHQESWRIVLLLIREGQLVQFRVESSVTCTWCHGEAHCIAGVGLTVQGVCLSLSKFDLCSSYQSTSHKYMQYGWTWECYLVSNVCAFVCSKDNTRCFLYLCALILQCT